MLVTVGCLYLGWQWQLVQKRSALQKWAEDRGAVFRPPDEDSAAKHSMLLRLMGDKARPEITFPSECFTAPAFTDEEKDRIERTFPEAEIMVYL